MIKLQTQLFSYSAEYHNTYAVLAFSNDLESPVVLWESDSYSEAEDWVQGYTRFGDWGGYDEMALYEVAPYESVDTIHTQDSPFVVWEKES